MTNLTRDALIKSIVSSEMFGITGEDYTKQLKEIKHKWEHASSEDLCKKYGKINDVNVTVDQLIP